MLTKIERFVFEMYTLYGGETPKTSIHVSFMRFPISRDTPVVRKLRKIAMTRFIHNKKSAIKYSVHSGRKTVIYPYKYTCIMYDG